MIKSTDTNSTIKKSVFILQIYSIPGFGPWNTNIFSIALRMDDKEKIKAAIAMLKQLKRMVGFFMKKEISELIDRLETKTPTR